LYPDHSLPFPFEISRLKQRQQGTFRNWCYQVLGFTTPPRSIHETSIAKEETREERQRKSERDALKLREKAPENLRVLGKQRERESERFGIEGERRIRARAGDAFDGCD
jgi:hypothetical protein